MKKEDLKNLLLLLFLLSFFSHGCSRIFVPKYLREAQEAIDNAYCMDAPKECPKEYGEVLAMWDEAQALYRRGLYKEGIEKANTVRDMANKLCPPPEAKEVAILTPPPVVEEPREVKRQRIVIEEVDSDGDDVPDSTDKCPDTPKGVRVDAEGCPLDSDGDTVPDHLDKCPRTPKCATVNKVGCWVLAGVHFDFDKWNIKPEYYAGLDKVVNCIQQYPGIKIEIQGHTDSIGSEEYNQGLSERRANEVRKYFINKGISKDRLTTEGFGFFKPIDTNKTKQGRAMNRRVELKPIY